MDKYTWVSEGSSYVLSDVLAAILEAQLDKLEAIQARRARVVARYREGLASWAAARGVRLAQPLPERVDRSILWRGLGRYALARYANGLIAEIEFARRAMDAFVTMNTYAARVKTTGISDEDRKMALEIFEAASKSLTKTIEEYKCWAAELPHVEATTGNVAPSVPPQVKFWRWLDRQISITMTLMVRLIWQSVRANLVHR